MKQMYVFIFLILATYVAAKENEKWAKEKIEQVHVGNFALKISQQPGPLVGFGQNIVDKRDLQFFVFPDQLKGHKRNFIEVAPSILYGITDKLSLFVELPIAVKFRQDGLKSHGVESLTTQFEGVIYAQETVAKVNEITVIGNIDIPIQARNAAQPINFKAPNFFLATTLSHTQTDWYCFAALGGIITTFYKGFKFGNILLYQAGISKNIAYKADKWILNWMIEFDGFYRQRNISCDVIVDPNSGGNTPLLGPSLWFSTPHLILQAGISAVIGQHVFGTQFKDRYFISGNVGWKF
jgi:hypothetical protein